MSLEGSHKYYWLGLPVEKKSADGFWSSLAPIPVSESSGSLSGYKKKKKELQIFPFTYYKVLWQRSMHSLSALVFPFFTDIGHLFSIRIFYINYHISCMVA